MKIPATLIAALLSCSSMGLCQGVSPEKPLGDVAREHRAKKEKQKENAKALSLVEESYESSTSVAASEETSKPSGDKKSAGQTTGAGNSGAVPSGAGLPAPSWQSEVFDNSLNSKIEPLVVPAGTEIRVDLVEGKVIVPVRVGFATPIPALSKVALQVNRTYYPTGLLNERVGYVGFADYATLTAVTVRGATYPVQSNSIPIASPGSSAVTLDNTMGSSPHDATFVLSAPIEIER